MEDFGYYDQKEESVKWGEREDLGEGAHYFPNVSHQ